MSITQYSRHNDSTEKELKCMTISITFQLKLSKCLVISMVENQVLVCFNERNRPFYF